MLKNLSQELILISWRSSITPQSHSFSSTNFSLPPAHRFPTICASSTNKSSAGSRKVKSNDDLCNDLRDFISALDLPQGHVPTLKELSHHGRQDLANLVRRRGYKLIRELLATTTNTNNNDIEEGSTEKIPDKEPLNMNQQDDMVKELAEESKSKFVDDDFNSCGKSSSSLEPLTELSLKEKVAKFINNGELETVEESGFDVLNDIVTEESDQDFVSENPKELESSFISEEKNDQVLSASENGNLRSDYISTKGPLNANNDEDPDSEESQAEVNRLKFLLHQKELELSRLKRQIEKEKLALSTLQSKAETKIHKAQKLIMDKGAEMLATEDGLSELVEVEIEYSGDGEKVELAGSFNGWHNRIEMDLQLSSSIINAVGSRKSRLWKSVLWLYPGTYEIKFIVDGHWTVDPQRESVTKGTIHNNILRVHR